MLTLALTAGPLQNHSAIDEYVYQIRLRNNGKKVIKTLLRDFVFLDPETKTELSRHNFYYECKLKPEQTRTTESVSPKPPTIVITIGMLSNRRKIFIGK